MTITLERSLRLIVVIGVVGLAVPVRGQDGVPTDDRTCFCLEHTTQQVLTGCHGFRNPSDPHATAICWDEERQADRPPITVDGSWKMVAAGNGRCEPCDRRARRPTRSDPRGD